ncbi:hypothetical protein SAMN06295960_3589 [Paenibacillus aquistagni]|uniref:AhpC/TSA family protein n=1 Tax=Paenibacillus aquistagni TaxID=1852522 RepID=A0A1X7LJ27_9BACL|nr:hypothetical protein SAMN06295960_3589 [Paenibacillus aquistagni]
MVNYVQLSTLLEWCFIIFLLINSLYMYRKLHERSPEPAPQQEPQQNNSLPFHHVFPVDHLIDTTNNPIELHPVDAQGTILMLSVYGCSSCAELYPNMNAIADAFSEYQVAAIMVGTEEEINQIIDKHHLRIPIHRIEMHQMGHFGTFTFPFCYVLSNEGLILNKGHVQTIDEVSSLLATEDGTLNVKIS